MGKRKTAEHSARILNGCVLTFDVEAASAAKLTDMLAPHGGVSQALTARNLLVLGHKGLCLFHHFLGLFSVGAFGIFL
jgi:hypothetical protein